MAAPASRRAISLRAKCVLAGFLVASVMGSVHAVALRGYQRWARGGSDVESALPRPELALHDFELQTADFLRALFTSQARGFDETPDRGVRVHVITFARSSDDPRLTEEVAHVLRRLAPLSPGAVVVDLPALLADPTGSAGSLPGLSQWARSAAEELAAALRLLPTVPVALGRALVSRGADRYSDGRWELFRTKAAIPGGGEFAAVGGRLDQLPETMLLLGSSALPAVRFDVRDPDDLWRREPVLVAMREREGLSQFLSPAVRAVELALEVPADRVRVERGQLLLEDLAVPLADGFLLLDPRQEPGVVPAKAFLQEEMPPSRWKGSVVVLGLAGEFDRVALPRAAGRGVETGHAEELGSAVRNLLRGRGLLRPWGWDPYPTSTFLWNGWGPPATVALGTAVAFLAVFLPGRRRFLGEWGAVKAAVVGIFLPILLWSVAAEALLALRGVWLDVFYPCLAAGLSGAVATVVDSLGSGVERRQLKQMVTRMLPPRIAEVALQDPERVLALGGAQREVTVLFADLRGFTEFSDKNPPEAVVAVLREYQTEICRAILAAGGAVDKLIGDGTMAFFGSFEGGLEGKTDHALEAADAAVRMVVALGRVNDRLAARGHPRLVMGIGINTGPVVMGNMGTPEIFAYTVVGDTVNVASRLEGANKTLGTTVLLSQATAKRLGERYRVRPCGSVAIKGKAEEIEVFELLAP